MAVVLRFGIGGIWRGVIDGQAFGLSQVLEVLSEKGCFIKGNRGKGQTQKTYKGLKKDYYRCRDYQADDGE